MNIKRLIILLLAWACLAPAAVAHITSSRCAELSVAKESARPQWTDIGLHDVLVAVNGVSLTPPTTVRLVHNTSAGYVSTGTVHHTEYAKTIYLKTNVHHCVHRYSIYLLRSLRL